VPFFRPPSAASFVPASVTESAPRRTARRWTLYVNLLFAGVAFLGGDIPLRRTARDRTASLDIPGAILVGGGLFGLV
jgi:hypothetical protein